MNKSNLSIDLALILKKILVSGSFRTLLLRAFGVFFVFILSFFITNNFSVNEVGQYEFFRTFILLIGSICVLGTETSIIYFAGLFKAKNDIALLKTVYYNILKIIVMNSFLIVLVFFLFFNKKIVNNLLNDDVYTLTRTIIILLPFYVVCIFNTEALRAIDKPILAEFFRNIFKYISVCFGVLLFFFNKNYGTLTEYFIIGFIPLSILSQLILSYYFKHIKKTQDTQDTAMFLIIKNSFPMGVSNIIMFLILSIDVYLLKFFFGNTVVAYYAIAIKLITILSMVILSININISSEISLLFTKKNMQDLQALCKKTAKIIVAINVCVSLLMILFLDRILLLFGSEYTVAKNIFFILLASQLFTSIFGTVTIYLNMTGRAKVYQIILLLSLFINVLLNWILIPKLGAIGAAITLFITVIFSNISVVYYVYKKDKISLSFL